MGAGRRRKVGGPGDPDPPSLLADRMLGKLVRYLRLAGLDTAYLAAGDDPIEQVRRSGRTLLTRNRSAAQRCAALGLPCLSVRDNYPFWQAREILRALVGEARPRPCSRCVFCNVPLEEVADRTDAEGWVPPHVFRTQRTFKKCPACGRFFWDATQRRSIDRLLKHIRGHIRGQSMKVASGLGSEHVCCINYML